MPHQLRTAGYDTCPEHLMFVMTDFPHPVDQALSVEELLDHPDEIGLFTFLYDKTEKAYDRFPTRRDGTDPFLHPINVAYFLKEAKAGYLARCEGIAHDYIEESVDVYKEEHGIKDAAVLDRYETGLREGLESEVQQLLKPQDQRLGLQFIEALGLLTRHKRERYYRSINAIFNYTGDPETQEAAVLCKLADRAHAACTLSTFDERERMYQCYKNLFILNNAKSYLMNRGKITGKDPVVPSPETSAEKIFRKCGKATYLAMMELHEEAGATLPIDIKARIRLSFDKYDYSVHGLAGITPPNPEETQLIKCFDGIAEMYDARLHGDKERFEQMRREEREFLQKFFWGRKLSPSQFEKIIDYKDAGTLMNIIGRLLYDHDYVLGEFQCSKMCKRGQKCVL
ncbi:MAG: hypothetical protein WCV90_01710 [Candidatus Woesearchaeota archaeon]|jgi:hypothetical protein